MKSQMAPGVAATSPPSRPKARFTILGRRKKDRAIRGKLRIRSLPGAFLVLGVMVVVVGTTLAVAGYWPYLSRGSILGAAEGQSITEAQTSGWSLGAQGLLSTAGLVHSERMKLLGPVIMGVGLFILICANTVLYENRDRETQMLLAQMHSVICSVSAAVPSADLKEMAAANSMAKHFQWVSSLPAAHLNILCLQQLASSEPLLQTTHSREQQHSVELMYRQALLQTEALHHQETEPSLHSSHSDSCNSSQSDCNTQCGAEYDEVPSTPSPPSKLTNKLNNCLVSAGSMSTLEGEQVGVQATQPRRCHSMSYRTNLHMAKTRVCLEEGLHRPKEEAQVKYELVTEKEAGGCSQVLVNIPGQVLDSAEGQTHCSWPRLELGSAGRRYLKLENKEDSVDKLLDLHLEQQCSQWDKSYGSGPFQ